MTRFFERGTAFAEMERQMMMVPNFAPRGYGSAALEASASEAAGYRAGLPCEGLPL